jgi:hypothetical protein
MTTFSETARKVANVSVSPSNRVPPHIPCRNHETLTARGWLSHYNESCLGDQQIEQAVAITYGKERIVVMAKLPTQERPSPTTH